LQLSDDHGWKWCRVGLSERRRTARIFPAGYNGHP
jgi:hypothetical protein